MQRIVCRRFGSPDMLALVSEPTPAAGPNEVLVEVEAVGVSFVDGLIVEGKYQVRPELPFTPGSVFAGHVLDRGPNLDTPSIGARVACIDMDYGCYTSHAARPAAAVVSIPAGIDMTVAASAAENYSTLIFAVTKRVVIKPGEHVVVLGAGGSIGLAAVDVAHALGARVVAVASTEEKRAGALAAGADVAIDYHDLKDAIRSATEGGADVVFDPVGGAATESALRALNAGGRLCVLGFASGEIPRLPMNVVLLRNRSIIGIDWGDWSRADGGPEANRDLLTDVLARISAGEIRPPTPCSVPLAEAGQLLKRFGERGVAGKFVLDPR
jgi:NADPH2:quinone reductase